MDKAYAMCSECYTNYTELLTARSEETTDAIYAQNSLMACNYAIDALIEMTENALHEQTRKEAGTLVKKCARCDKAEPLIQKFIDENRSR